jgi:hypothetical protein
LEDLEQSGYQAAFSRLATSEGPIPDPVERVKDVKIYVATELSRASEREPGKVNILHSFRINKKRTDETKIDSSDVDEDR